MVFMRKTIQYIPLLKKKQLKISRLIILFNFHTSHNWHKSLV